MKLSWIDSKMGKMKKKKYRKCKNSEISYNLNKTLVLFIIYGKCGNKVEKSKKKN